jgi:hypothetical protein
MMLPVYLETEESFSQFLEDFALGRIARQDWNHAAHLAMAAARVVEAPQGEAFAKVKESILRYADLVGIEHTPDSGFHETVTRFWTDRIEELVAAQPVRPTGLEAARAAVIAYAARGRLFDQYYSFDVVKCREARARYVAPDREP